MERCSYTSLPANSVAILAWSIQQVPITQKKVGVGVWNNQPVEPIWLPLRVSASLFPSHPRWAVALLETAEAVLEWVAGQKRKKGRLTDKNKHFLSRPFLVLT